MRLQVFKKFQPFVGLSDTVNLKFWKHDGMDKKNNTLANVLVMA